MAPTPDDKGSGQTDEKDIFVRQLPKRIAAIEDIWVKLSNGNWDNDQLEALYDRVREISEASKAFALFQLNESVFSLEVYLSSFVGSDITPGSAQLDAITGLLRALKTAANATMTDAQEVPAPSHGAVDVYMLGSKEGLLSELSEALRNLDCDLQYFADAESLLQKLQIQLPKVIVADTSELPEMPPLSAELVRLHSHTATKIPLIFVSSSTNLQLRVDAIRAGGDGYFVAPLDAAAVAMQVREMALPEQQTPYRVLVVEDDPTQADFAASILRKAGMEVMLVTEPVKVIKALHEFKPDLILMDIYMPEVNGLELTTIIRDHKEFVTIPIVFVSGEQNTDKQLDALSVGGDDFIAKPIRPKHLLGIVETKIRRARQLLNATGQPPKHDRVTGLFSRPHFLDQVARFIDEASPSVFAGVILVQPDKLASLQERIGVGGIDHLLAELGSVVSKQAQSQDLAARIDEHSIGLLLKRDREQTMVAQAQKILGEISRHAFSEGLSVTASIGLCTIDGHAENANGIIARAHKAAAQAATDGGNRVQVHTSAAGEQEVVAAAHDDLAKRIKTALKDDSFIIQYQPMLDLQTRGSETYEIVLRVQNAQGDLIGDRQLLDAAEEAGVGEELDQWILERAIDILKQRRESGRRTQIFVHQSAHSALDVNLPAWLLGRLRAKQVVGTGLVVDFRLPDLSHDLKLAQATINSLRDMDVGVCLSRFPEKEAAFKVLRFLKARYINIAPRLLKADRNVISSIIRMAHDASAKVIVSNVDDPRSIDLHWSSGADFLQGNFIQRPLENMDYDFGDEAL